MSNSWTEKGMDAALNIADYAQNLISPTLRLGVTGLSRSGKTVFITSLIYHLLSRSNLPFFEPLSSGRIRKVYLEPHPDDLLPRFDYEGKLACLTGRPPAWPEGTKKISQLRLTIEYESEQLFPVSLLSGLTGNRLHIDIIDYPGEWLLDLPLLEKPYELWCKEARAYTNEPHEGKAARDAIAAWHSALEEGDPNAPLDEGRAKQLSDLFRASLIAARDAAPDLPTIPPGRFLMPGDLEGSPALTFAPLIAEDGIVQEGTLAALMKRRYEAYKTHVIRPFYRRFFTRLDRQILLVDLLSNLNAGPTHLTNLGQTLSQILKSFNPGASHWLTSIWHKKIDRLVIAATKADHLHHHNHDQLQDLLAHLTQEAIERAELQGAEVKVQALAALRTTKEVEVSKQGETYHAIKGRPAKGTSFEGRSFNGEEEIMLFPGDLPESLASALENPHQGQDLEILNFSPPISETDGDPLPHIRLDRALNMLIGDKLR